MIVSVIDTETGDFTPEAKAVEIAVVNVLVEEGSILCSGTSLIKPTSPVSCEARAVHHISDEELSSASGGADVFKYPFPVLTQALVAHNMAFDLPVMQRTFPDLVLPELKICTYRCALHLWPNAPSHKNQVLRYWRNLNCNPPGYPHRALYDAVVTAHLLMDMIKVVKEKLGTPGGAVEELVRLTTSPVLLTKLRFGKHSGVPAGQVPYSYWKWILGQDFDEDIKHTARHYLDIGPF